MATPGPHWLCLLLQVCILPIFMLAYANGFVDHILRAFQRAAFDDHDFKRIGGRDRWMEFIKGNPAYWCIFGRCSTVGRTCRSAACLALEMTREGHLGELPSRPRPLVPVSSSSPNLLSSISASKTRLTPQPWPGPD